jgi:hypothetical protein
MTIYRLQLHLNTTAKSYSFEFAGMPAKGDIQAAINKEHKETDLNTWLHEALFRVNELKVTDNWQHLSYAGVKVAQWQLNAREIFDIA